MLAAPQDIAVDGLALTALSPRNRLANPNPNPNPNPSPSPSPSPSPNPNRELAATCNAVGQSAGYLLAYAAIATSSE